MSTRNQSSSNFMAIVRFFLRDPKNLIYALVQTILSCTCTLFNTLEYCALALIVPLQVSSQSPLNKQLLSLKQWLEANWLVAIGVFLAAFCLRGLCNFLNAYVANFWKSSLEDRYRSQFLGGLLAQPLISLEQHEPGHLAKTVEHDAYHLAQLPFFVTKYFIALPIIITTITLGCALISWNIILLMALSMTLFALCRHPFVNNARKKNALARSLLQAATASVVNYIQGIAIIKALQLEIYVNARFHESGRALSKHRLSLAAMSSAFGELAQLLSSATVLATVAYAFYGLHCTIQEIIIIAGSLSRLHKPIKELAESQNIIGQVYPALSAYLELPPATPLIDACFVSVPGNHQLKFDRVAFAYGPRFSQRPLSFTINRGDKIALMGKNGSGKSTLLKLLCGIYAPCDGQIIYEGVVIGDHNRFILGRHCTYATQKSFLFSTSIRENIDPTLQLPFAQIQKAAQQACVDQFINELPQGYETVINNDGAALSLGQKQKLHLARAFARNTPLLILDESTNSLDRESENFIMAQCLAHHEQTQIFVSHRPEILSGVNRIFYFDEHGFLQDAHPDQAQKYVAPSPFDISFVQDFQLRSRQRMARPNETLSFQKAAGTDVGPTHS